MPIDTEFLIPFYAWVYETKSVRLTRMKMKTGKSSVGFTRSIHSDCATIKIHLSVDQIIVGCEWICRHREKSFHHLIVICVIPIMLQSKMSLRI